MDLKQVEYIIKIAEENNITRAAEKLFITQSALNQQLLKLERELATPLFHRSRNSWSLTEAGEIYIKNANEILRIKRETYNQISDITTSRQGHLAIGFTPGRGISMFTSIYPSFHKEFPNIIVEPLESNVHTLQQMIDTGTLDIAFLTLRSKDKTKDHYITLSSEEIVLVLPSGHPLSKMAAPSDLPFATLDISLLKYEPFVLMNKHSTMRSMVDGIFDDAGFSPLVLFETTNHNTILSMIKTSLCCGLVPYYYIKSNCDGISCFSLPSKPKWDITATYKKDSYLSDAAKYFITLGQNFWS